MTGKFEPVILDVHVVEFVEISCLKLYEYLEHICFTCKIGEICIMRNLGIYKIRSSSQYAST